MNPIELRRRAMLGLTSGLLGLLSMVPLAAHAAFPDKPIKILVPWPPGGATDQVARILVQPLTQALGVMAQAVDNEQVGERIRNIRTGVERGDTLTRSATATGMFTPLVLQMLAVGEETGAVDRMLAECASFYEREVDYDVKNLSSAIEPILIVVLAGFVLIFALGIFLPMWDLAGVKLQAGH